MHYSLAIVVVAFSFVLEDALQIKNTPDQNRKKKR